MPETGQNGRQIERYRSAWNAYGMRRGLIFAVLAAFVIAALVLDRAIRLESKEQIILLAIGLAILAACFAWLHAFRCPRCGEAFYKGQKRTRACQNCGLRLNEIPGETP